MAIILDTTTILAITSLLQLLSSQIAMLAKKGGKLHDIDPDDVDLGKLDDQQKLLLDAAKMRDKLIEALINSDGKADA